MGIGLFEYAASNPGQVEPEQARQEIIETVRSVQDQEKIGELKDSIALQIRQGREPQYILYTAVRVIAMLTNDSEWEQRQGDALDSIYKGIAQESLFRDNAAEAASRRAQHLSDYVQKTRRQITKSLNSCRKLEKDLEDALQDIEGMTPDETE